MSGHSKWNNIKRRKGANDAARGKIFSKLIKEIVVAARTGGGDPAGNLRLKAAINKARQENMPGNNVERAIKRGIGGVDGIQYEEIMYEGYGPGGAAIMVQTLTDNRKRTAAEIRHLFSKGGGKLGVTGCVSAVFARKGIFEVDSEACPEERLFEVAVEAGAEDVETSGEVREVRSGVEQFEAVRDALGNAEISPRRAEIDWVPLTAVNLEGSDAKKMVNLLESLEDNDDVQNVFSNFDFDEKDLT